jgi:hypothetical protein
MTVLSLPSSAGIARMRWELQRNDVMSGVQALRVSDPLWRVSLEFSPDLDANSGYLKALAMRLRGPVNQLEMYDWSRPAPVGTMRGVLTLASGVAAGATSMSIVAANDNLIPSFTESFDNAAWVKGGTGFVTADQIAAPDGLTTADYFAGLSPTANYPGFNRSFTVNAGTDYAVSAYAQAKEANFLVVEAWGNGTTWIKTVINRLSGSSPIPAAMTRVSGFFNSGIYTNIQLRVLLIDGVAMTWTGTKGLYLWGLKLNLGQQPTAYGFGNTLKKGDLLGIGSGTTQQVVMVTEDAVSTSQGNIAVQFQPPLRNAFSAGQSVVWDKPKALFRRVSNELGWDYRGKNLVTSGMTLDLVEDTRA